MGGKEFVVEAKYDGALPRRAAPAKSPPNLECNIRAGCPTARRRAASRLLAPILAFWSAAAHG